MISQRLWVTVRKRKSLECYLGRVDKWRVVRQGWFLFGVLPLFIKDVNVEKMN